MMRAISLVCLTLLLLHSGTSASSDLAEGIAAFNNGRYSVALFRLHAAAKDSQEAAARVYLALTEAALNDCATALPILQWQAKRASKDQLSRLSGLAAAKCLSATGQSEKALSVAEGLKSLYPKDADVLYVAADTEMKAFNDTTFAMFQHTPASYRVHELSARIFEIQNRFADAVGEYRKAIDVSPQAPDLHFRLGRAILLESHSNDALVAAAKAFQAELAISPEDSACDYQLGQIAQVQDKTEEARVNFERALNHSPAFVAPMISLSRIYSQQKQYDRAVLLLERAIKLQPENEAAHYALLTTFRDAGKIDKAKAEKATLDRLQKPPEGEFTDFLKRLGDKQPAQ